jgi:hypothetical protein
MSKRDDSQWMNDDVVTTTYGSVQLSLRQAYSAGAITERERIIELLQGLTHTETDAWDSDSDVWLNDKWINILSLIKGGENA